MPRRRSHQARNDKIPCVTPTLGSSIPTVTLRPATTRPVAARRAIAVDGIGTAEATDLVGLLAGAVGTGNGRGVRHGTRRTRSTGTTATDGLPRDKKVETTGNGSRVGPHAAEHRPRRRPPSPHVTRPVRAGTTAANRPRAHPRTGQHPAATTDRLVAAGETSPAVVVAGPTTGETADGRDDRKTRAAGWCPTGRSVPDGDPLTNQRGFYSTTTT